MECKSCNLLKDKEIPNIEPSHSKLLVDSQGRIYAVLAGRPDDPTYTKAAEAAFQTLAEESSKANFVTKECNHKRGCFPAVSVGLSYGQGQLKPALLNTGKNTEMVERLIQNSNIQRIATFGSGELQSCWLNLCYKS